MSAVEKWNKLVELYNKHFNDKEEVIQNLWENIFVEFFGYSRFGGEIERQRNIRIGSTERVITDIIIKESNTDLFIIELKQYNLSHSAAMELQLMSYLKQLRLDTGILVCDKIYVFDYDYGKADDEQNRAEIAFTTDNPDGVRFVEMFSKNNFTKSAVKDFIRLQSESVEKVDRIKEELSSDLAVELLKNYFSDKYGEVEFAKAINGFNVTVTPKGIAIATSIKSSHSSSNDDSGFANLQRNPKSNNDEIIERIIEKCILIKIKQETVYKCGSVYEAVRAAWVLQISKAEKADYVFAVLNGKVEGVYENLKWSNDDVRSNRLKFDGTRAVDIEEKYKGKTIPSEFRKKGSANPCQYVNC